MTVEGNLDLFQLPEILQLVSQQQKTGILTVQGQQDIVAISFLGGRIVAADALNQTVEEGVGKVLVADGLLSATEFARTLAEQKATGGRLLDLLAERRHVPRPRLLDALRLQTCQLLEQLLAWSEGDFKFYSGDEVSYEEGFVPISVEEVLLRAGEAAALAPPVPADAGRPAAVAPAAAAAVPARQPPIEAPPRPRPVPAPAVQQPPPPPPTPAPAARPPARLGVPAAPPAAVPAEASPAFRRMTVEPSPVPAPYRYAGRGLALLLAALLAAVLLRRPAGLVLPYPWQDAQRRALVEAQREAESLKIDRAAKTFFLLQGRFPERLAQLREQGLLAASDLVDPEGHGLDYSAREVSYTLQPVAGGRPLPGAEAVEGIAGNFLLDPEFVASRPETSVQPLVLLD